MKYNAEDILHQSFERKFRGYDPEQVHEFLQGMAREWDFFLSELTTLQTSVADQSDELKELRRRERGLLDALSTAREVADEMEHKARERSAAIVSEAQERADKLVAQAERQQSRLLGEIKDLQSQRGRLDNELRSVLESHMGLLDEDASQHVEVEDNTMQTVVAGQGPTIHRKPRTHPPESHALMGDGADEDIDEGSHETLIGVVTHAPA